MALAKVVINQTGAIREFEKPEVCEAIKVANANRWTVALSPTEWDERKARLKKEYEENTKAPGSAENSIKGDLSGNKSIEHCGEPIPGSPLSAVEGIKLKWKDNRNTSENPALEESASQFNDALLDEQAKKIVELTEENERLKDQVAVIYACKENNEKYSLKQIKRLGKEIAKLNCIIHDKNAILSDVAEELRLTKIREKNLAELGLKYVGENEKLKKKLADKIVNEIDARALKSAESALAYKEKVIAEKDEVIADLGKELTATKKELEEKTKLIEEVRKYSKEYCEYGIEAVKMIRKMAKAIVGEKPICSEDFEEYRRLANGYMFNPQLPDFSEEEEKKLSLFRDHSAIIAQCCKNIAISKDEAEIIERCTKNGTELHYSEKDGFTYTNMFGDEMPIICLRGMCQVFTDEEIKNMKK